MKQVFKDLCLRDNGLTKDEIIPYTFIKVRCMFPLFYSTQECHPTWQRESSMFIYQLMVKEHI